MLLISSSFATAGASVVTSVPCTAAAWFCASCWQTAASNNAETSGV